MKNNCACWNGARVSETFQLWYGYYGSEKYIVAPGEKVEVSATNEGPGIIQLEIYNSRGYVATSLSPGSTVSGVRVGALSENTFIFLSSFNKDAAGTLTVVPFG